MILLKLKTDDFLYHTGEYEIFADVRLNEGWADDYWQFYAMLCFFAVEV